MVMGILFPEKSTVGVDFFSEIPPIVYTPWTLHLKEFVFGGIFLLLLSLSSWSFVALLDFHLEQEEKSDFHWHIFGGLLGSIVVGLLSF